MSDEPDAFVAPEIPSYAAAPGVGLLDFDALPDGTSIETISFFANDGVGSRGVLYTRGGETGVVCISHPRADMSRHYAVPAILEAGYAAYVHQCRGLNNDVDGIHEKLLLDLSQGFGHLKHDRGYKRLMLLGNSGGGSLMCFYQGQAQLAPADRLKDTPAGDPINLAMEMPQADGIVLLGTHPGEGLFMLDGIDPSVLDEDDPLSVDPALDMYNPDNGFRLPPEASTYSQEFLDRYRAAQRARVARLDARARGWIADQQRYQAVIDRADFGDLPIEEQIYLTRRAVAGHYMIIYRTEANPAYCDLSLKAWKSTRKVGSIIGPRPDKLNYSDGGFARYITPRAWLSSWSGLSSRAAIVKTMTSIDVPILYVSYTGDSGCFPVDNQAELEASPSTDKTLHFIDAEHYGRPLSERAKALALIAEWLRARF